MLHCPEFHFCRVIVIRYVYLQSLKETVMAMTYQNLNGIKKSIKDQLLKFDGLSRKIEDYKKAMTIDPNIKGELEQKLHQLDKRQEKVHKNLNNEEYKYNNLLNDRNSSLKKLEKQMAKVSEIKTQFKVIENEVLDIKRQLGTINNLDAMKAKQKEIKGDYKMVVKNLMNMQQKFPDVYKEIEKETGVYFLTAPSMN